MLFIAEQFNAHDLLVSFQVNPAEHVQVPFVTSPVVVDPGILEQFKLQVPGNGVVAQT